MISLDRVAGEIKHIGFYDMLYQDIKDALEDQDPPLDAIKTLLQKEPHFLEEYKQLNVEYNISNIHIRDIDLSEVSQECRQEAEQINKNLQTLRKIEKYTLDFEKSSFLVILFSVEFFVLFSVQYFIVLLSLKAYQWYIYGLFLTSILIAWWYAQREKKKYQTQKKRFEALYQETRKALQDLVKKGCIDYDALIIQECEEHI